jgi:hypothetical protein
MSDESVVDPPSIEVAYRGLTLVVKPLNIGKFPKFTRAVRPMFAALAGAISSDPSGNPGEGGGLEINVSTIVDLVADHGESMIEAAAVATDKNQAWISEGSPGEFIALVRAIIEVNADFFAQAVARMTTQAPGPTPSSS